MIIVSPALADSNNGNWQTARRWQQFLSARFAVRIDRQWRPETAAGESVMIALHARRSADSIAAWAQSVGTDGLIVALTGTDLYRDIQTDPQAQQSLQLARHLIVLQECGPAMLSPGLQDKTRVIVQSTTNRATLPKTRRHFRAMAIGHLRPEKDPATLWAAATLLQPEDHIDITHLGQSLQAGLADQARATQARCPHYRWLGPLPHEATRKRLQRAHVLVHPSQMEGGAHVVMEAVCSGTPVLASRIDGNVGMLGADYEGYFPVGDAQALVALLRQARDSHQAGDPQGLYARLMRQCAARAALFAPAREQDALLALVTQAVTERNPIPHDAR